MRIYSFYIIIRKINNYRSKYQVLMLFEILFFHYFFHRNNNQKEIRLMNNST